MKPKHFIELSGADVDELPPLLQSIRTEVEASLKAEGDDASKTKVYYAIASTVLPSRLRYRSLAEPTNRLTRVATIRRIQSFAVWPRQVPGLGRRFALASQRSDCVRPERWGFIGPCLGAVSAAVNGDPVTILASYSSPPPPRLLPFIGRSHYRAQWPDPLVGP